MDNISDISNSQFNEDPISFEDACRYLRVSRSYLYKATSKNVIKHYKPSKKLYFYKSDLRKYISDSPVITTEELDRIAADYSTNKRGVKI